jgi:hypothetical protein
MEAEVALMHVAVADQPAEGVQARHGRGGVAIHPALRQQRLCSRAPGRGRLADKGRGQRQQRDEAASPQYVRRAVEALYFEEGVAVGLDQLRRSSRPPPCLAQARQCQMLGMPADRPSALRRLRRPAERTSPVRRSGIGAQPEQRPLAAGRGGLAHGIGGSAGTAQAYDAVACPGDQACARGPGDTRARGPGTCWHSFADGQVGGRSGAQRGDN